MPSILTIKQREAVEACNKMSTSFTNLNTQVNVTHTSFNEMELQANNRQVPINDSNSEFTDIDSKASIAKNKTDNLKQKAKDMSNLQ